MPEAEPSKQMDSWAGFAALHSSVLVLIGHAKLLLPDASRDLQTVLTTPAAWGVELIFSLSGFLIGRRWVAMETDTDRSVWKSVNQLFLTQSLVAHHSDLLAPRCHKPAVDWCHQMDPEAGNTHEMLSNLHPDVRMIPGSAYALSKELDIGH